MVAVSLKPFQTTFHYHSQGSKEEEPQSQVVIKNVGGLLSESCLCGSAAPRLRSPAAFSLSLLASPRCLPHFRSLSSVRQLSYWHSHHLLRTGWISFLQKSFALCQSRGGSHLPGHFPFTPFSSLFSSHACSFLQSPHLCTLGVFNHLSALSWIHLHLSGSRLSFNQLYLSSYNQSEILESLSLSFPLQLKLTDSCSIRRSA